MGEIIRWGGFVVGLALVLATWSSIIVTIIVPRSVTSRITFFTWRFVQCVFMFMADRRPRYEQKDRLLSLLGPVALLAALLSWMFLFLMGYALLFWPLIDGGFNEALKLAGSSFFTLGVASSPLGGPTVLEFLAAASGMIVIALQIGYLPTIYGAYNRRETLVSALSARAGVPTWGPEVLARHQLVGGVSTLPTLFASWETWAADIIESHISYPWLMSFRSPNPLNSWLISQLAMLDAAALYLALAPSRAPAEATHCLRAGYVMLRALARMAGSPVDEDPHPDALLDLTYEQFVFGVEHIRRSGFLIEREPEQAWRDFRGWRVNYEAAAYSLADWLVAVPAPWSGFRRNMTRQEAFDALANRPRHRTPDDPEGLGGLPAFPEHLPAPTLVTEKAAAASGQR